MADDDSRMDLIRRYLLNQLSPTEKADFQTRLLLEPELLQEVQMMRAAQKVLRTQSARGLNRTGRLWLLGLVLVLMGAWYAYWNFNMKNGLPTTAPLEDNPVIPPVHPSDSPAVSPSRMDTSVEKEQPVPTTSRPVAAAFQPNPALERYVAGDGSMLRGADPGLVLDLPRPDAQFQTGGRPTTITVAGSLKTGGMPLRVHLFSNDPAAYAGFKPAWSADLPLSQSESGTDKFSFQSIASPTLPAGLYYLLLENSDSGAVLKVTRIRITPAK